MWSESESTSASGSSTNRTQPPVAFWLSLESVPGGTALHTIWKRHLDKQLDAFKSLFLRPRPDQLADAVPCPWNCGCFHKVVPQDNGTLYGICQCALRNCDTYTVAEYERIPWELDWPKIAHVLGRAFALQVKTVKLGLFNTLQIGAWSDDAIPVVLTLSSSPPEFLNTIAVLVARLGQPFILLAPTRRHLGPTAQELLANTGSAFFALEDHLLLSTRNPDRNLDRNLHPPPALPQPDIAESVSLSSSLSRQSETAADGGEGRGEEVLVPSTVDQPQFALIPSTPPCQLFANLAPLRPAPADEELARRIFLALQQQDQSIRRRPPSLYTVFQLYCLKELSMPKIARQCRCSLGTVANRLKLLQSRTGVPIEQLRRVSPHFVKFNDEFHQAQRNYRRRSRY